MQHLEQFHREAVNKNLSAGAILLWQQLYFTMERKNQFADLPLNTAVLTAQLKVSRQGLALMRQALADNGLLAVHVDEHQQTFYTLMLNGKTVGDGTTVNGTNDFCAMPVGEGSPFPRIMDMAQSITGTESAQKTRQTAPAANDLRILTVGAGALDSPSGDAPFVSHSFMAMQRDVQWPSPTDTHTSCVAGADAHTVSSRPEARQSRSGEILAASKDFSTSVPCTFARNDNRDIILTNRIRPYIDQFCDRFGPAMKGDLIQWAEMRRKNGWTLTLWGLEALFKKLIDLSGGIGAQMAQIVAQSVTRRWKGFFALKVKAKPSGEALRKQEELHDPRCKPWEKPNTMQKFKPEGRDLSFLEV